MKKIIVDSWTKIPGAGGLQISMFADSEKAFSYAENEYYPYGYNTAFWSSDTKTLHLFR